jgi:hypothetical protein
LFRSLLNEDQPVRDDPKLPDDGGEISKSQGRGWQNITFPLNSYSTGYIQIVARTNWDNQCSEDISGNSHFEVCELTRLEGLHTRHKFWSYL